jgi:hypothetical protein
MLRGRHISILLVLLMLLAGTAQSVSLCDHILLDTSCTMVVDPLCDIMNDDCCEISIPDTKTNIKELFTEKFNDHLYNYEISSKNYIFQNLKNLSLYRVAVLTIVPKRTPVLRC